MADRKICISIFCSSHESFFSGPTGDFHNDRIGRNARNDISTNKPNNSTLFNYHFSIS